MCIARTGLRFLSETVGHRHFHFYDAHHLWKAKRSCSPTVSSASKKRSGVEHHVSIASSPHHFVMQSHPGRTAGAKKMYHVTCASHVLGSAFEGERNVMEGCEGRDPQWNGEALHRLNAPLFFDARGASQRGRWEMSACEAASGGVNRAIVLCTSNFKFL